MRKASFFHQEMSTTHHFYDFQFSEFSEKRKKVDMDYAVSSSHCENSSLKSESVCDLRKSLAWDSAFFTSPGVLDPEELFGTVNTQFLDDGEDITQGRGRKSLKLEFPETDRTSATRESSVRKSLAWDSAFLTCEGVLNAEELSIVNRGFRKSKQYAVPETDEQLWRSGESSVSTRRDDYSLSSLEVDLFDDMRSSMPNFSEASRRRTTASYKIAGEKRLHNGHSARKPTAFQQDFNGVSSSLSSSKPPKVSGPTIPPPRAPKKRTSLGANKGSLETKPTRQVPSRKNLNSKKSMTLTKKTCLRDSLSTVSSSTSSTKTLSSVLHSAKKELTGFSGHKSPNPLRKTDSQLVSSVMSSRTPPKFSVRNRSDSLLSTPKSSSCVSPVSSAERLLSGLSGSSAGRRLNLSAASKSAPCGVVPFDFVDAQGLDSHNNVPILRHEIREVRSPLINRTSTGSGASPVSPFTDLKTSGLRMPSPKIGFFDTESPTGLQLDEHPKFQSAPQGIPKTGTGSTAENRIRNHNPVLMQKFTGTMSDTSTKLRVSSREKQQRSRLVSDKNFHNSEEDNKENAGSLENQVEFLIKRIDSIGLTNRKGGRSLRPLPMQNTRNQKH